LFPGKEIVIDYNSYITLYLSFDLLWSETMFHPPESYSFCHQLAEMTLDISTQSGGTESTRL
jgi:hypothetical protein